MAISVGTIVDRFDKAAVRKLGVGSVLQKVGDPTVVYVKTGEDTWWHSARVASTELVFDGSATYNVLAVVAAEKPVEEKIGEKLYKARYPLREFDEAGSSRQAYVKMGKYVAENYIDKGQPDEVVDADGDRWKREYDGTYRYSSVAIPRDLNYIRNNHGIKESWYKA